MKQVHKSVNLTRVKCVNNILKIWNLAQDSDKYDWYDEAYRYALKLNELTCIVNENNTNKTAGVIAALSPCKSWDENKKQALKMVTTGDCGHMMAFKEKARQIIASDGHESTVLSILRGQKIQSFYLNIRYPDKAINLTIDRHALSICLGHWVDNSEYTGMTKKQYQFFSSCYRHASAKLGVNPLMVQSVTWLTWRKIKATWPTVQTQIKF